MIAAPRGRRRRRSKNPAAGVLLFRRRAHWTAYLPLALALLLAAGILWFVVTLLRWFSPAGPAVSVPRFVGMSLAQASVTARDGGVRLHVVAHRNDYRIPKDQIIGQLPAAGEAVREGRAIDVIVSDGIPVVQVPNVTDVSLHDATIALENAKLKVGRVTQTPDPTAVDGTVVGSHPDVFAEVPAGTPVDLVLAKGRPYVRVPDFSGLPLYLAQLAAKELGLTVTAPKYLPIAFGAKPYGTVVSQKPAPGQTAQPKQTLAFQLSGGPPPTPEPLPSLGEPTQEPSPTRSAPPQAAPLPGKALPAPNAQRGMRVVVTLPSFSGARRVRVVLLDAMGERTLYENSTKGGISLSFNVVIYGAATVETYADDALISANPL